MKSPRAFAFSRSLENSLSHNQGTLPTDQLTRLQVLRYYMKGQYGGYSTFTFVWNSYRKKQVKIFK